MDYTTTIEDFPINQSFLGTNTKVDTFHKDIFVSELSKTIQYREWQFGRGSEQRKAQPTDLPNNFLLPDASNLALVLHELEFHPENHKRFMQALQNLYPNITGYKVRLPAGFTQLHMMEGETLISASRLSDGTLRYLCLLAILCHPEPPPLICIEEPELGLHPDILPTIAELLKEAAERTQLIVTTHSEVLVDCFTDQPESILVCEKGEQGTEINRLDPELLKEWLVDYGLGELWTRGHIGGNRW